MTGSPRVTVVVPTYRRGPLLRRCLEALRRQSRRADEIVVVRRPEDQDAALLLREWRDDRLVSATVDEPGVIAAMAVGAARATGDIIAFTDDDAEPRADWLARLVPCFDDPKVGGAGGRDVVHGGAVVEPPTAEDVGRVGRWGRVQGNHHVGSGPARDVAILKGVNMAFRREAFALPRGLRGTGAQVHFEIATSLWARRRGWRLVYDPSIVVDHFPGPRREAHDRQRPSRVAIADAAYNLVASLLSMVPGLAWRRALYGIVVGDRGAPGLMRAVVGAARREWSVVRSLAPSLAGQLAAVRDHVLARPIEMTRVDCAMRPRVALVAHDVHDHGGMEHAFAELIRGAREQVDFVVVSATLGEDLRRLVDWEPVAVPRRPFPLKFVWFFVAGSLRLRRLGVDLVHTMGAIVGRPVDVASVHFLSAGLHARTGSLAPSGSPPLRRLNHAVSRALGIVAERWCYRPGRARVLAPVSRGGAAEVARLRPGLAVAVVPNGIEADRFHADVVERQRLRRTEDVGAGDVVVLFVGGDWDRKGLAIAIEAMATAAKRTDARLRLWVVGEGDRARFERIAARFGVESRCRFFGFRVDVERFFQAADVFVLPTSYETFSLVAHQAAVAGLPVVATRVSGVDDLIGHDEAGMLVDRDATAFAEAIVALAADPARRARLGEVGQRRARAYTWERSVDDMLAVYASLLPGSFDVSRRVQCA